MIDVGCTQHDFPATRPSAITFYADPGNAKLQGMKLSFNVAGQSSPTVISAGPVDQSGQEKYEHVYDPTATLVFFGFQVSHGDMTALITDNTAGATGTATINSAAREIIQYSVINYDPARFTSLKDTIDSSDAKIASTEDNIAAAQEAQLEWGQIAIYEKVIEADVVTGIAKVAPTSAYVLRQSEAVQI